MKLRKRIWEIVEAARYISSIALIGKVFYSKKEELILTSVNVSYNHERESHTRQAG